MMSRPALLLMRGGTFARCWPAERAHRGAPCRTSLSTKSMTCLRQRLPEQVTEYRLRRHETSSCGYRHTLPHIHVPILSLLRASMNVSSRQCRPAPTTGPDLGHHALPTGREVAFEVLDRPEVLELRRTQAAQFRLPDVRKHLKQVRSMSARMALDRRLNLGSVSRSCWKGAPVDRRWARPRPWSSGCALRRTTRSPGSAARRRGRTAREPNPHLLSHAEKALSGPRRPSR
jgi:hypothetical protein